MRSLRVLSVSCLAFVTLGLFAQPVVAVTGDINGDDIAYATDDLVYLLCYLFENGPPPRTRLMPRWITRQGSIWEMSYK